MDIAVGFICLMAVAVLEGITGQSERYFSNENPIWGNDGSNSNMLNGQQGRPSGNYPGNTFCESIDGRCVRNIKPCPSRKPLSTPPGAPYCNTNRRCCHTDIPQVITCEENGGTAFKYDDVLYCTSMDIYDWMETRDWCVNFLGRGWSMAEPADPIGLALYSNNSGVGIPCGFWLGGLGDGSNQFWLNGTVISNDSSLWFPGFPFVEWGFCLALLNCFEQNTPLFSDNCSIPLYPLCQYNGSPTRTISVEQYSDDWNLDNEEGLEASEENEIINENKKGSRKNQKSDEDDLDKFE